jgi:adenine nucleotide transporter 17
MTSHLPPLVQATAGSLGAVVSGALVFPADTLVKRNQVKRSARRRPTERAQEASRLGRPVKANHPEVGAFEAVVHTLKTEGLLSLYSGLVPDSLSTLLSQFLYFLCYTALRTRLVKRKQRLQPQAPASQSAKKAAAILLSPLEELGIGCLAGVVAKGIVSPLSMITVRAQTSRQPKQDVVGGRPGDKSPVDPAARTEKRPDDSDSDESDDGYSSAPSTLDLAREIYDEQGLAGFWSGFSSTVILVSNLRSE